MAESSIYEIRKVPISRALSCSMPEYGSTKTGDLASRITNYYGRIRAVYTGGLVQLLGSSFTVCSAIVLMLIIDPALLLIILFIVIVTGLLIISSSGKIQKLTKEIQKSLEGMSAELTSSLDLIRLIRSSNAENFFEEKIGRFNSDSLSQGLKFTKTAAILSPWSAISVHSAFVVALGVGAYRIEMEYLAPADLISFLLYFFMLVLPLANLLEAISNLWQARAALELVNSLDCADVEISSGDQYLYDQGRTEFVGVSFCYSDSNFHLEDISFDIQAGTIAAIVGSSGAGKTTLLDLLMKFREASSGERYLDGQKISSLSRAPLREKIALVDQNSTLFSGTVYENLTILCTTAERDECWRALDLVGLTERFSSLEDSLSAKGSNLSGGELQVSPLHGRCCLIAQFY